MKTEQIIETLRDFNDFLCECDDEPPKDSEGLRLTIEAAIGELQFAENKLRLVVARQNELIQRLKEERDEAREEAEILRALYRDAPWVYVCHEREIGKTS